MTENTSPQQPIRKQPMAHAYTPHSLRRLVLTTVTIFLLLAGVTSLIVWLIYRPTRPHFSVVGAAVYDMNTTSSFVVSTTMQFTVLLHNPNKRVAIYYDHLTAHVSYRNQAITPPLPLPPLLQGHRSTVAMSPMVGGAAVPVAQDVASGLVMDQAYGVVDLRLILLGRLRWKAGAFKSGRYGMYVRCDMFVALKKGFVGQVPLLGSPDCMVDI